MFLGHRDGGRYLQGRACFENLARSWHPSDPRARHAVVAASSLTMVSEAAGVAPAQAQEAFLDNTSVRTALSSTVPGSIAGQNASFVKSFADAYEHINSVAEAIEQTGGDTSAVRPTPPPRPSLVDARTLPRSSSSLPTSTSTPPLAFDRLGTSGHPPRPQP